MQSNERFKTPIGPTQLDKEGSVSRQEGQCIYDSEQREDNLYTQKAQKRSRRVIPIYSTNTAAIPTVIHANGKKMAQCHGQTNER